MSGEYFCIGPKMPFINSGPVVEALIKTYYKCIYCAKDDERLLADADYFLGEKSACLQLFL